MTYFKWTEEKDLQLIELRDQGLKYPAIAEAMGCSYNSVKQRGSKLIKAGIIEAKSHRSSPTGSYTINEAAPKSSVQELLQYVVNYPSRDSCPSMYRQRIITHFGSWTKALEAAGLPGNIGGKMDTNKATKVYLLDFGEILKIGITQRTLKQRFSGSPPFKLLDLIDVSLEEAIEIEKELKQAIAGYLKQPTDPWFKRNGKTECFAPNYSRFSVPRQELKLEHLFELVKS